MIIIGAGMAGLLAGAMLRDEVDEIVEAQPGLPNNHSAVLRFRSKVVADVLSIPFREVKVAKSVAPWSNPIADALAYSAKATGKHSMRSILGTSMELETRYIAPPDLIDRMSRKVSADIRFGEVFEGWKGNTLPIISTIPMPSLMEILGWETEEQFSYQMGLNVLVDFDPEMVNAYCSLYVPDPKLPFARLSLTGSQLIIECYNDTKALTPFQIRSAVSLMGIEAPMGNIEQKVQRYGKINVIDDRERRRFIMHATDKYNIYSLGRFATWRPGLLLDDVVSDVRQIQGMITNDTAQYIHRKERGPSWTYN